MNAGASALAAVAGSGGAGRVAAGDATAQAGGAAGKTAAAIGGSSGVASPPSAAGNGAAEDLSRALGVDASAGFVLTVYHTPVESFHTQPKLAVTGCSKMPCANGTESLGAYPADFVQAAKDEGAGRIVSGSFAGKYLNWSIDIGYWLDEAPRDARGQALIPWVSAAADPKVAFGTRFQVSDCGKDQEQGTPIDATVCAAIRKATWMVNDRFTVGSVGAQFDLYIGEEDHADFDATSPYLITAAHAQIQLVR